MTREKWEAMTSEQRSTWKKRKEKREFLVFSVILPIVISASSALFLTPRIVMLLIHK